MKTYCKAFILTKYECYSSPIFNSFKKAKEWINNEMSVDFKYANLTRIEINTTTYNENGSLFSKEIKYYYEW